MDAEEGEEEEGGRGGGCGLFEKSLPVVGRNIKCVCVSPEGLKASRCRDKIKTMENSRFAALGVRSGGPSCYRDNRSTQSIFSTRKGQ